MPVHAMHRDEDAARINRAVNGRMNHDYLVRRQRFIRRWILLPALVVATAAAVWSAYNGQWGNAALSIAAMPIGYCALRCLGLV